MQSALQSNGDCLPTCVATAKLGEMTQDNALCRLLSQLRESLHDRDARIDDKEMHYQWGQRMPLGWT